MLGIRSLFDLTTPGAIPMPPIPEPASLTSRRSALFGAAALLGALPISRALGQDATPAPVEETLLFVQVAESGTAEPIEGESGGYHVTLANGSGQTLYFSDRPERLAGIIGTGAFMQETDGMAGQPNAALAFRPNGDDSETKLVVLELHGATFDPESLVLTYEARFLDIASESTLALDDLSQALDSLPANFGQATLFIDPYVRPYHSGSLKPVSPDIVITHNS
jgi:hypothetical protein